MFDFSNKLWRKDSHSYIKRKNTPYTLESQSKLRIDGKALVKCSYCSGDGSDRTPASFRRRAYWMLDNPDYVLVHYIDEGLTNVSSPLSDSV